MEPEAKKLKISVMGLSEPILAMLDVALSMDCFEVTAAADEDAQAVQAFSQRYGCPAYTDFRRMIMQNPADVLFVGAPLHTCGEHIRQAIQNKCHIIKMPPAGLTFEQCASLVQQARREGVYFVTAIPGRFEPAVLRLRQELADSEPDYWHLITAVCHVPQGEIEPQKRWLLDPKLSGGGVLIQNAYDLLDEMVLCFGLPQQVYAVLISQAPDRQQRLSITEDNAVVSMKFSDTLAAQVMASRTLGPERRHLRMHGKDKFITLTREDFSITDNSGNLMEHIQFSPEQFHGTQDLLDNFAKAVLNPSEKNKLSPPAGVDLYTMAVIESAYLSARTSMPETPSRLLDMAKANVLM
ncbi:MAG: Gfo/Idh/MocA family oxidoreductase [Planctomycetes bacterium]|nr:Gfo/Idh/MocA family oxidoreductase [Planctomycetota bacterium]